MVAILKVKKLHFCTYSGFICVHACVQASIHACVHACLYMYACVHTDIQMIGVFSYKPTLSNFAFFIDNNKMLDPPRDCQQQITGGLVNILPVLSVNTKCTYVHVLQQGFESSTPVQ